MSLTSRSGTAPILRLGGRDAMSDGGHGITLRGVGLGDVYRDREGDLWEVVTLCDQPQAGFRRVRDAQWVEHVIGCPNMQHQFPNGPLVESSRG